LGENGDDWVLERIGTDEEKLQVEKELAELRERLSQVEAWKQRREEIERELTHVVTEGGDVLPPPPYLKEAEDGTPVEKSQ